MLDESPNRWYIFMISNFPPICICSTWFCVYFYMCNKNMLKISNAYSFNMAFDIHYDVIKWKHFSCYWPFARWIHRSPVNSPHKGQWRGALMFSLICVWINVWVNNREAGDLRRYRPHHDVTVMKNVIWHRRPYWSLVVSTKPKRDAMTLHCNTVSHWLSTYPELFLNMSSWTVCEIFARVHCDNPVTSRLVPIRLHPDVWLVMYVSNADRTMGSLQVTL